MLRRGLTFCAKQKRTRNCSATTTELNDATARREPKRTPEEDTQLRREALVRGMDTRDSRTQRTLRLCWTIATTRVVARVLGLSLLESNAVAPQLMNMLPTSARRLGSGRTGDRLYPWLVGTNHNRKAVPGVPEPVIHPRIWTGRQQRTPGTCPNDNPRFARHMDMDPRAAKALRGWPRRSLVCSRWPIPWALAAAMGTLTAKEMSGGDGHRSQLSRVALLRRYVRVTAAKSDRPTWERWCDGGILAGDSGRGRTTILCLWTDPTRCG